MNELLLAELKSEHIKLLDTLVLIEEFIFGPGIKPIPQVQALADHCLTEIESIEGELAQAENLINELFINQLFLDKHHVLWPVTSHQIVPSLLYRIMSPSLKCILIAHIIRHCGFEANIVYVPDKMMVQLICDEDYTIIFDPIVGESLTWEDLSDRMADSEHFVSYQQVEALSDKDVLLKHLSSLKAALIRENNYRQALKCMDVILALQPDDPYQRRDRGFLLQQLDCFKVAYDDYRFFVEQCPQDPAAQLLKKQLENITISDTILH
ncbi:tetratricopeptide repeat protein [Thalassotalea sp. LPB0316]|uniref:tetratricopeptide repeat protein n=1 Tax=Thalassotalea sp. LPB0316 TaxID=2769490 RepID=UPI0018680ACA|nr:tetratricopeptide repeat protein [Thalassotalea sp. LPB0316]QOL24523.1 tetratricopeptide repeat protein [Thalassotalea sp. LPB0316]